MGFSEGAFGTMSIQVGIAGAIHAKSNSNGTLSLGLDLNIARLSSLLAFSEHHGEPKGI